MSRPFPIEGGVVTVLAIVIPAHAVVGVRTRRTPGQSGTVPPCSGSTFWSRRTSTMRQPGGSICCLDSCRPPFTSARSNCATLYGSSRSFPLAISSKSFAVIGCPAYSVHHIAHSWAPVFGQATSQVGQPGTTCGRRQLRQGRRYRRLNLRKFRTAIPGPLTSVDQSLESGPAHLAKR